MKNKILKHFKEYLEVIPSVLFLVLFMVMAYMFMLVTCASDDECYNLHMNPIQEVPYVSSNE
jgi:ABC-type uncharacterized transport system permease subunit